MFAVVVVAAAAAAAGLVVVIVVVAVAAAAAAVVLTGRCEINSIKFKLVVYNGRFMVLRRHNLASIDKLNRQRLTQQL